MKHYPHLFSPIKIGPLTLKNRICVSPMTITGRGEEKGYFAQDNIIPHWQEEVRLFLLSVRPESIHAQMHVIRGWRTWMIQACFPH